MMAGPGRRAAYATAPNGIWRRQ